MSFTPLSSMAIYPKYDHTHKVSSSLKQNSPIDFTFALSPFCFSLFSFPSPELNHHHMSNTITLDSNCSNTWNVLNLTHIHLEHIG